MKVNNMKINMTNIYKAGFTVVVFAILFGFVSCKNSFSETLSQKTDSNTYLMICDGDVSVNSRTVNPSADYALENLTSVYLYAKKIKNVDGSIPKDEDENQITFTEKKLAGSSTLKLSDLYKKQLLLEDGAGYYTIRMTAKLDNITFYKKLEDVKIEEDKTNLITLKLEPVSSEDNLDISFADYGGFSFTINANVGYANQDIDSIYVTLKHLETGKIIEQRYINRLTEKPKLSNKTVYEHLADKAETESNGRVPVGTYRLTLDFLALDQSTGKDILVNSYPYIIKVIKGHNTHFEETFELNKVYKIEYTYNTYDNTTPAPGERIRTKFTSKNEVKLPRMQKEGYAFKGWYIDRNHTGEPVEKVEENTLQNQRFYAWFEPSVLYVDATGDDSKDGTSSENALKTLAKAVEKINAAKDSSLEWYIYLSGTFTEPQTIAGNYQDDYREPILAKSINIVGDDAVLYSTVTSPALTILTDTPVSLKSVEITGSEGGSTGIYMGYDDEHSDNFDSQLTLGSGVQIHNNATHGVHAKNGTVYLYDSVIIDDLYSEASDNKIVLLDNLASEASVTISPDYYSEPSIQEGDINKEQFVSYDKNFINFANNKDQFHVTPETTLEGEVEWIIDEEGCLNKECKINFIGDGTEDNTELSVSVLTPIWKNNSHFQVPTRTGYKFMGWYYVYEKTWYDGHDFHHEKFIMEPFDFKESEDDTDFTHINSDMTVYATWRYLGSSNIYVNANTGADGAYVDINDDTDFSLGDGTEEKPLRSVGAALELIKLINDPSKDYTITISGKTEDYNLAIDNNLPIKSLVLQGKTSAETDGIYCSASSIQGFESVLKVSTTVPVTIQNMLVKGELGTYDVDGAIMNVGFGSTVTLEDGAVFDASYSSLTSRGAVAVENGGTLIMEDGVTFHNFDIRGGAVYVKTGGTFTMNGGTFENNTSNGTCGAVYVNGGTFTMNDGYIKDNWQDAFQRDDLLPQGAGVCVASGTFIMEGGHITNNGSYGAGGNPGRTTAGGGVFVYADGEFIMRGGEIADNHAYNKLKYSDGEVVDDSTSSSYGGGVCLQASGTKLASFTMTGGTISGNTAGTSGNGIGFLGSLDEGVMRTISLGADAIITNNDIYLPSNVTIKIVESMTGGLDPEIRATITPQEYKVNQPIFSDESVNLAVEYTYFAVTPQGSTTWTLNEEGKLASSGAGNDPYTNPSSYTVITGGTIGQVTGGGSIENECNSDNTIITIPNLYVANSLVTRAEYETYMNYYGTNTPTGEADTPVYYVSWIDAIIYCNLRSIAEQKTPVYSLNGETNPDSTIWTNNGVTSYENRYWYNSNEDDDSWDTEVEVFDFNLDADGYRLMTSAECRYISSNYPDFFTGSTMDEWTQTYSAGYEAQRLYYSYVDHICVEKMKGNATREPTLGFRVVHKVPSNP